MGNPCTLHAGLQNYEVQYRETDQNAVVDLLVKLPTV